MADEIELLRRFRDEIPGPSTDAWTRARAAIAAARAEEEPAANRRWRWLFSVAAGATLAGAGAGLLAVMLAGPPAARPGSGLQAGEAAYVVSRAQRVLSSQATADLVGYARTVLPPGSTWMPGAGPAGGPGVVSGARSPGSIHSAVGWWYQGTEESVGFSAAGQRVLGARTAISGAAVRTLVVNYRDRTWWRDSRAAPAGNGLAGCDPAAAVRTGDWPAVIRGELRCGQYRVAGRQRVDGISALVVTQRTGSVTVWVDPVTYLPVRLVTGGRQPTQTDFRWLSPTAARLGQLNLPVPAGFRQVRSRS